MYNTACYLDTLKVVPVDTRPISKKGEFRSGTAKNCCKNGDYHRAWVNVALTACEGKTSGHTLTCIWVMDEETVVAELSHKVSNVGCISKCTYKGSAACKGRSGKSFLPLSCRWVCGATISTPTPSVVTSRPAVVLAAMHPSRAPAAPPVSVRPER